MEDKELIGNYNKCEYTCACVICGTQKNLMMFSHRNKMGSIVGWLFCCDKDKEKIIDKKARVLVTEERELKKKVKL